IDVRDRGSACFVDLDAPCRHLQSQRCGQGQISLAADADQRHVRLDARAIGEADGLQFPIFTLEFGKMRIEMEPDITVRVVVAQEVGYLGWKRAHQELCAGFDYRHCLAELGGRRREFETNEAATDDYDVLCYSHGQF